MNRGVDAENLAVARVSQEMDFHSQFTSPLPAHLNRYLSGAKSRPLDGGIVLEVSSKIQASFVERSQNEIEAALSQKILRVEIRSLQAAPRPQVVAASAPPAQINLSLPLHRKSEDPLDMERKSRASYAVPRWIESPAMSEPLKLLEHWTVGIKHGASGQVFWVSGAAGSGKSTLLKQLINQIDLRSRLRFTDVRRFFEEWRRAMDTKTSMDFVHKWRRATDVLVLENIEELQSMPGTLTEVLLTVRAILENGGAVAVSSKISPRLILDVLLSNAKILEKRTEAEALVSRLFGGIVVDLPVPDRAFKEALWRSLLEENGYGDVPIDLRVTERLFRIQARTAREVRSLFANTITKLDLRQGHLLESDLTDLEMRFHASNGPSGIPATAPREILEKVASLSGTRVEALKASSRARDLCLARRLACLALKKSLGLTNQVIADLLEKDPSTITLMLRQVEKEIQEVRNIRIQWDWLAKNVGIDADPVWDC